MSNGDPALMQLLELCHRDKRALVEELARAKKDLVYYQTIETDLIRAMSIARTTIRERCALACEAMPHPTNHGLDNADYAAAVRAVDL